jgi:cytochrome c oxidase assembly factor CtaG/cytochrome c2
MMLHAGEPLAPHDLWSAWSFEPGVIAVLGLTAGLYARGMREALYRSTRGIAQLYRERSWFIAGLAALTLAMISPLHAAGGALFTAHMIQHELLMAIGAPMLVLGRPGVPLLWGLPDSLRASAGGVLASRSSRWIWRNLSTPAIAFLLHGVAIWVWHEPSLYNASVTSSVVHSLQHISFIATALLFWWSVLESRHRRTNSAAAVISLFLTAIHTTLLGALLAFSETSMYAAYPESHTIAWGLTPLDDQQLGGLIMWIPGGAAYVGAALYLVLHSIRESARRAVRIDAERRARLAVHTAAILICLIGTGACTEDPTRQWAAEMTGGTPSRGREAIRSYGCQSCHTIPGVTGAKALVGPPLAGIASRSYIAGVLSNSPQHMIEWLRNPPGIDSKTAMPNMNVTERDARDIAAYLYTLR